MDPRLLEACMCGDEQALHELVRNDPLILDRAVTCSAETPLHVAVLRGHLSFVRALLGLQPELAYERDASGCVPLHLASAKGSAEIVQELLSADAELCSARDHDGRTPLHLGVMKGRLDVVREFIRVCPLSASERLDRGETVFHLSIKYCRLETLKLLVELLKDQYPQLLVATDNEGNTVLHFAAFFKQIQAVKYLVFLEEIKVIANATNDDGHIAMEVMDFSKFEIWETPTQALIREIRDLLHRRPQTTPNSAHTDTSVGHMSSELWDERWLGPMLEYLTSKYQTDWITETYENLMVVATVIAGTSFQIGMSPPGGVWQTDKIDSRNCTKPGMCMARTAVLKGAKGFNKFYSRDSWALLAAVVVVLLQFGGYPVKNKVGTWLLTFTTCATLNNILVAYAFSTAMVVKPYREDKGLLHNSYAWRWVLSFILIIHSYHIWHWLMYDRIGYSRWGCRRRVAYLLGGGVPGFLVAMLLLRWK